MVRHAYGVLRVNSFATEMASDGSGRALFPLTALISHSCQPNVLHDIKITCKILPNFYDHMYGPAINQENFCERRSPSGIWNKLTQLCRQGSGERASVVPVTEDLLQHCQRICYDKE